MYIGPETIMPVASVFAAVAGVALMFWRRLTSFGKKVASVIAAPFSHPTPSHAAVKRNKGHRRKRNKRR